MLASAGLAARGLDGENGVIRSLAQAIRRPYRRSRPTQRRYDSLQRPIPRILCLSSGSEWAAVSRDKGRIGCPLGRVLSQQPHPL